MHIFIAGFKDFCMHWLTYNKHADARMINIELVHSGNEAMSVQTKVRAALKHNCDKSNAPRQQWKMCDGVWNAHDWYDVSQTLSMQKKDNRNMLLSTERVFCMNFGCTRDELCKLWLGQNLKVIAERKSTATTRAKSIVIKAFIESACLAGSHRGWQVRKDSTAHEECVWFDSLLACKN